MRQVSTRVLTEKLAAARGWLARTLRRAREVEAAPPRMLEQQLERESGARLRDGPCTDRVLDSAFAVRNENGGVAGSDTSWFSPTERELLQARLDRAQRLQNMGQLAGGVAHDFNNLLTVILASAEMASSTCSPDSPARPHIQQVLETAERAATLTKQLLTFARKQVEEPRVVDLNDVVQGLASLLRRTLGDDVELITRLDDEPRYVEIDPGQLEQVIVNLAINARDAMLEGGTLTLQTTARFDSGIRKSSLEAGRPRPVLRVRDTGVGMSPHVRKQIFEPFFTTKSAERGTGLGLSICDDIVRQAGGEIHLDSRPGEGTTFEVTLPAAAPPVRTLPTADVLLARGFGEAVLVVDDNPQIRALVTTSLQAHGYRVTAAASGQRALELAAGARFDLLLTDLVMPNMSGMTLADKVRRLQPGITTLGMSGFCERPFAVGPDQALSGFISKPFTGPMLARKVRELLDTSATAEQPERAAGG